MVTTKLSERNDVGQALWTLIDNSKYRMRIGLIYAPQENKTLNKDLQKIYQEIEEQAKAATENNEMLMVMDDFNCKVGEVIPGNSGTVNKGGRLLTQMTGKNNMIIMNAEEVCQGLWTRQQGEENSVIDYVLMTYEDAHKIK